MWWWNKSTVTRYLRVRVYSPGVGIEYYYYTVILSASEHQRNEDLNVEIGLIKRQIEDDGKQYQDYQISSRPFPGG